MRHLSFLRESNVEIVFLGVEFDVPREAAGLGPAPDGVRVASGAEGLRKACATLERNTRDFADESS